MQYVLRNYSFAKFFKVIHTQTQKKNIPVTYLCIKCLIITPNTINILVCWRQPT